MLSMRTTIRSGLALGTLLFLQIGDCSLPVLKLSEADRPVDAEILQKHAQHVETLSVAGEDPTHVLDLLGCLIAPLVGLLVRPPATLTADIPLDGFHRIAPLADTQLQFERPSLYVDCRALDLWHQAIVVNDDPP